MQLPCVFRYKAALMSPDLALICLPPVDMLTVVFAGGITRNFLLECFTAGVSLLYRTNIFIERCCSLAASACYPPVCWV